MATFKDIGTTSSMLSPEQVASRRKIAQAMIGKGTDTSPVGHWTQALARVVQGGIGGYSQDSADEGEREGRRQANMTFTKALTNKAPMKDVATALMGNPYSEETGQNLGVYSMKQDAENEQKALDRAARTAEQKELFSFQRNLAFDLKKQEQDAERQRMLDMIETIRGNRDAALAEAPAAPDGPPVSANDPNADFTSELLGGQRNVPTTEDKAATALAFGEKGKAVDILNEKGKLTEGQTKDALFAERLLRAEADIRQHAPTDKDGNFTGYDPAAAGNVMWPNDSMFNSDKWKGYYRGARESLAVILRKDTGAAITDQEWENYGPTYLPQPGDPPAVIQAKQKARIAIAHGLRNGSGEAFARMFPQFDQQMKARLTAMGADLRQKLPSGAKQPAAQDTFDSEADIPEGAKVRDEDGNVMIKQNGKLVPLAAEQPRFAPRGNPIPSQG
jgi:hypothetical protein